MATLKTAVKKFFKRASVKNPNALATQAPYRGNFSLSPNSAFMSLGGPELSYPGATGAVGGPGIRNMQKKQIVYGERTQGNFFDLGGGWTFGAFDKQPTGGIFNRDQS